MVAKVTQDARGICRIPVKCCFEFPTLVSVHQHVEERQLAVFSFICRELDVGEDRVQILLYSSVAAAIAATLGFRTHVSLVRGERSYHRAIRLGVLTVVDRDYALIDRRTPSRKRAQQP
ncbi:unnamed protein product [Dibothriocephalus latus]|uniref:Uncharacterized protein n=1 Tax=Dibothriocephalus latus TaxID=60516 RepID=A0A3P7PNV5_DIBLA|nr:unnamed protein product [Dibothriocephalus latus]